MGLYEKIKMLTNEKKMSIRQLEEKMDYGNGTIRRWENSKPSIDKVEKVANYFDVSVDYLLGRTDNPQSLSKEQKREQTVEEALKSVMSYDGKEVTDNDREILKSIIEAYLDKK